MSKGSSQRPKQVSDEVVSDNWQRIFKRCKHCGKPLVDGHIHTCSPQVNPFDWTPTLDFGDKAT